MSKSNQYAPLLLNRVYLRVGGILQSQVESVNGICTTALPPIKCAAPSHGWRACYDRAAMNTTRQREHWDGDPIEPRRCMEPAQTRSRARFILVTHPLGWELRLMTPELLRSQLYRSSEEILSTGEQWKAAMIEKSRQ